MSSVLTLPTRCKPWPLPLAAETDLARVNKLVTEANLALDRLVAVSDQVRERLAVDARALPHEFDREEFADDWYRRAIEPLRVKGVFDEEWVSAFIEYQALTRLVSRLFTEWAVVADRLDVLSERQDDIELMLDQLVDAVLDAEIDRRLNRGAASGR